MKQINLIKYNGIKMSFKILAPTMSSILGPKSLFLILSNYAHIDKL